ncbi:MAG: CarD family transcriptional regulator [Acutalibacteraceae bacterium]
MFGVGDTVLYGSQGVCRIVGTEEKELGGNSIEYFVLKPVYDENSTLFVPMSNSSLLSKMKSVLSAEQIYEMIKEMPTEDTIWIDDDNERKQKYQQIINDGNRHKLVQLIKTLHIHEMSQQEKGRKLHISDEIVLKQAEKLLYDEFALVLKIKPDEVLPFIMQQIQLEEKV